MKKTIYIILMLLFTVNVNAQDLLDEFISTPKMIKTYNTLTVKNKSFIKWILHDILSNNAWKMDESLLESFWTVINYFQSLEDPKSKSYQAVSDLENAIVGFSSNSIVLNKLTLLRTQAINHFLQKVSPELVGNQQFISILKAWQKEAEQGKLWTRIFFKSVSFSYTKLTNRTYKKLSKTPKFLASLDSSNINFWGLSEYFKEKQETKGLKDTLASKTSQLKREKKETKESIRLADISRNIWNILQD